MEEQEVVPKASHGKKKKQPRDDEKSAFTVFKEQNRKAWLWFNIIGILISLTCLAGTVYILQVNT